MGQREQCLHCGCDRTRMDEHEVVRCCDCGKSIYDNPATSGYAAPVEFRVTSVSMSAAVEPPSASPEHAGARRQAFLEAADVASRIRDEYEERGRNHALGLPARDRANRDATIARQIKGAILAFAKIQDWPAPKPERTPAALFAELATALVDAESRLAELTLRASGEVPRQPAPAVTENGVAGEPRTAPPSDEARYKDAILSAVDILADADHGGDPPARDAFDVLSRALDEGRPTPAGRRSNEPQGCSNCGKMVRPSDCHWPCNSFEKADRIAQRAAAPVADPPTHEKSALSPSLRSAKHNEEDR